MKNVSRQMYFSEIFDTQQTYKIIENGELKTENYRLIYSPILHFQLTIIWQVSFDKLKNLITIFIFSWLLSIFYFK